MRQLHLSLAFVIVCTANAFVTAAVASDAVYEMKNTKQLSERLVVGGQPSLSDFDVLKTQGVSVIISLQVPGENEVFDEASEVEKRGMMFVSLPVEGKAGVTFENARRLQHALMEVDGKILVHCASSNRVGALFALTAIAQGTPLEESVQIGKNAGLSSLESLVRELAEQKGVPK